LANLCVYIKTQNSDDKRGSGDRMGYYAMSVKSSAVESLSQEN